MADPGSADGRAGGATAVGLAPVLGPAGEPASEPVREPVRAPVREPDWPPSTTPSPPLGLYVHVPFCVARCPYCDFAVVAGGATRGPANRIGAFLEALLVELELRADALDAAFGPPGSPRRPPLQTCYVGGGTPSLLGPAAIERILARVGDRFGLALGAEVSLEANPGPDERGDPAAWREAGVTRLSFGGQSLQAHELRALGRRHGAEDVLAAVEAARRAGIGSINVDLLYDVPGQSLASFAATLDGILAAGPDHVSCYGLELEVEVPSEVEIPVELVDRPRPRPGALAWRRRALADQDPDRAAAMYELAADRLAEAGYRGYEISNWARPGHECRHNLLYWTRRPVEALGPGAHAFDGRARRWTTASLDAYLAALRPPVGRPRLPPGGVEVLDERTARAEALILGLRTDRGLPAEALAEAALADEAVRGALAWAFEAGLVEWAEADDAGAGRTAGESGTPDRRLRLSRRGRLVANEVLARLV